MDDLSTEDYERLTFEDETLSEFYSYLSAAKSRFPKLQIGHDAPILFCRWQRATQGDMRQDSLHGYVVLEGVLVSAYNGATTNEISLLSYQCTTSAQDAVDLHVARGNNETTVASRRVGAAKRPAFDWSSLDRCASGPVVYDRSEEQTLPVIKKYRYVLNRLIACYNADGVRDKRLEAIVLEDAAMRLGETPRRVKSSIASLCKKRLYGDVQLSDLTRFLSLIDASF